MTIVAIVGVLTALMAASIGLVQYDIKRVLAYSTVSQLGYMFTAMGVGAFSAGAFHLMTHAFFKALLFLGSGSVIHAMGGEQDMRRMGGLKKYLPVTFATMLIGTLAIAGIPPFAGFFSKDEILFRAFLQQQGRSGCSRSSTALMTAFYMFRLMAMTFFGAYRGPAWERRPRCHARGRGGRRGARRRRIRPTRTRTARPRSRTTRSRTDRPSRTTATARTMHDDARRRTRPWAVARAARIADADDVPADGAGGRRDRRRLRRHSGGARRRQRDRALPRAELHGGGTSHGEAAAPPSRAAAAAAAEAAGARGGEAHASRGVELGLMGFSVLIAVDRHRPRAGSSTSRARRFPSGSPSGLPARIGCCRTSTTSTSSTTRRSSPARSAAAAACGRSIATSSTARSTARAG